MHILWLDLGNTRLKYWLTDEHNQILEHDAKEHLKAPNELLMGLFGTFCHYKPVFVAISSVLGDKINHAMAQMLGGVGLPFEFVQVDDCHPYLTSHYNPSQLGVDRWLQMLGAVQGDDPQIIVGCGTALTIDVISQGTHQGGYILPNAYMQRHALYAGTQQISIKQGRFESLELGCTTFDAVNHGILFGIVSAVAAMQASYPTHELILTGGGACMLRPHLMNAKVDENLLLKGLQRYFEHRLMGI